MRPQPRQMRAPRPLRHRPLPLRLKPRLLKRWPWLQQRPRRQQLRPLCLQRLLQLRLLHSLQAWMPRQALPTLLRLRLRPLRLPPLQPRHQLALRWLLWRLRAPRHRPRPLRL